MRETFTPAWKSTKSLNTPPPLPHPPSVNKHSRGGNMLICGPTRGSKGVGGWKRLNCGRRAAGRLLFFHVPRSRWLPADGRDLHVGRRPVASIPNHLPPPTRTTHHPLMGFSNPQRLLRYRPRHLAAVLVTAWSDSTFYRHDPITVLSNFGGYFEKTTRKYENKN